MKDIISPTDKIRNNSLSKLYIVIQEIAYANAFSSRNEYLEFIMKILGVSKRTAYDYFNMIFLFGDSLGQTMCGDAYHKVNKSLTIREKTEGRKKHEDYGYKQIL